MSRVGKRYAETDGGSVHETQYDAESDRALSTAVVEAVAAAADTDPIDAEFTLYDNVEPDALDSLVDHALRRGRDGIRLEFPIAGYRVVITGDGAITVRANTN